MQFREIYETHFDFVWRSLRRLGVREADVPDALQEVFLVAFRRLDEFEGRAKVSTWLFRIAMGVARNRARLAHSRREVLDDDALSTCADERRDQSAEAERNQQLELLDAALARMDLDQRAVFTLFELEGHSGDEIAAALQIPVGTVWSRLRLGREAFKKAMARVSARGVAAPALARGAP